MTGKVYLVGAGPGDPELITVKGRRLLGRAGCILYDHLASPRLLDYAPATAERIYVGKKRSQHAFTQAEICAMMIERARAGCTVIRLKGGDPFIFGRGGEEVEALAAAGVPFEVVPGVTAPLGIAASTGVPLTHREHTSIVTFVTGHDPDAIDWPRAGMAETLVIFMGLHHLDEIARRLIEAGREPTTPAMAVRWGTRPDQVTITGTIETLPGLVHQHGLTPPATVLIGEVVRLRESLDWFERRPLFGRRVVVTRARSQSAELVERLCELGADVIEVPVIELRPPSDTSALDAAIARLADYDWLIFTSTNAVEFFLARLAAAGRDFRSLRGRICAIGAATKAALEDLRLIVDLVPEASHSEGLVKAFEPYDVSGARVLLPRAAEAREVIPQTLRARGAVVDVVDAYRNVIPEDAATRVEKAFAPPPDWVTFTSGSTVKNLLAVAPPGALAGVRIATIGPATSEVARAHGLNVDAEARESTTEGLVDAVVDCVGRSLRD